MTVGFFNAPENLSASELPDENPFGELKTFFDEPTALKFLYDYYELRRERNQVNDRQLS